MSKREIIMPSADAIAMMMWKDRIPDTGEYYTVKSTPSIIDDPFAHVLDYK